MKSKLSVLYAFFALTLGLNAQPIEPPQPMADGGGYGGGGGTETEGFPVPNLPPFPTPPTLPPVLGGGEFAPTLPIHNIEALVSYAKSSVASIGVNVWSRGIIFGGKNSVTHFNRPYSPKDGQADFIELSEIISSPQFSFNVRNPDDPIEVSVQLRDRAGIELFSGARQIRLEKGSGTYILRSPVKIDIYVAGEVPIEIPGAENVEMSLMNERGETVETRGLNRLENGRFMFPVHLAGQGRITLTAFRYSDSGPVVAVYSAETGRRQLVDRYVGLKASAEFRNAYAFPTDYNMVTINPSIPELSRFFQEGRSPLLQLKFSRNQSLYILAEIPGLEQARGLWIRRVDVEKWAYFLLEGGAAEIQLSKGVWDVILDWPTFGKRQYEYDGGKG